MPYWRQIYSSVKEVNLVPDTFSHLPSPSEMRRRRRVRESNQYIADFIRYLVDCDDDARAQVRAVLDELMKEVFDG